MIGPPPPRKPNGLGPALRGPILAACAGLALFVGGPTHAGEDAARPPVPEYRLPAELDVPALPPRLASALERALATLADAASPEDAQDAARLVAGLGAPALPAVAEALRTPVWAVRVRLISAIAEMDAPQATPLLVAAARDPAFGVREAALVGLGKTGDERAAAILTDTERLVAEPVWRVRRATAAAVRRAVLRGKADPVRGGAVLVRLLEDPDRDVRLAALEEVGQLSSPAALPHLLDVFAQLYRKRTTAVPAEEPRIGLDALRGYRDTRDERERATAVPEDERRLVLDALRGYRDTRDERLVAALIRGFTTAEPELAVEAGRTLFDLVGVEALADERVADAALRHLMEKNEWRMREALGSLGRDAAPWFEQQARDTAHRIALRRGNNREGQLEHLVDLVVKVDPDRGVALLRSFLTGADADTYTPDTRRLALERASTSLAARLGPELRELFASRLGRDLRVRTLAAIVKSGGDDVDGLLAAALDHEESRVVLEAIDLISRRPQADADDRLANLAAQSESPTIRRLALRTLAQRDHERAATLAEGALGAKNRDLRQSAISILGARRDDRRFELLLARFRAERPDDETPRPPPEKRPDEAGNDEDPVPAVTTSDRAARLVRTRKELLRALRGTGGERAIAPLFETLENAENPGLRRLAAQELRHLVGAEHALRLVVRADGEPDTSVQEATLVTLAGLVGAEEAVTRFETLLTNATTRHGALIVLTQARRPVAPPALAAGLLDDEWTHEDKGLALGILAASGSVPPRETLVELLRSTHDLDLLSDGIQLLARHGPEVVQRELLALLAEFDDPSKRVFVVKGLGSSRAPAAATALREQLVGARAAAASAPVRNVALDLYEACAVALARCGEPDDVAPLLVRELLHPALVHAGARLSVPKDGPFQPVGSPTVLVIRALVRALAQIDDRTLAQALGAELERLAEDGGNLMLEEGYVEGVARYLRDPVAYGLPARRRPAAGLVLRRLVPRIAPRFSSLDADAWAAVSEQAASEQRLVDARDAWAAAIAIRDVEEATRSKEKRLWEQGKLRVFEARVQAKAGEGEKALATLERVRAPDPSSDELAYLHGYGLLKIGRAGDEARDSLLYARAQNPKYASATFYLAWVTDVVQGAAPAIALYERAEELDREAVENAGNQYKVSRKGKIHPWSYYPYYLARALARAGHFEEAAAKLQTAIRHDDREAPRARADAAFEGWDDLEAVLEDALSRIPD